MRVIGSGLVAIALCVGSGGTSAQTMDPLVDVWAEPAVVVSTGAEVEFTVAVLWPGTSSFTVVEARSERYGDVADAANPTLLDTGCSLPSDHAPGQLFGAYDWGCTYRVHVSGEPGELADTVTVTMTSSVTGAVARTAEVTLSVTSSVGAIRGTITDASTGAPVVAVAVLADGPTDAMDVTDPAGRYSLEALEPGEYTLLSGNVAVQASDYAREFWDDAPDAGRARRAIVVGGEVTGIDWQLSLGGVVQGTVTDEATGLALGGVSIYWVALLAEGGREGPFGTSSDASGAFRIVGLHDTDVLVCFDEPGYAPECWDDRTDFGDGVLGVPGDAVAVAPGTVVSGIDAALAPIAPPTTSVAGSSTAPAPSLPPTGAAPGVALVALAALLAGGTTLALARTRTRPR